MIFHMYIVIWVSDTYKVLPFPLYPFIIIVMLREKPFSIQKMNHRFFFRLEQYAALFFVTSFLV